MLELVGCLSAVTLSNMVFLKASKDSFACLAFSLNRPSASVEVRLATDIRESVLVIPDPWQTGQNEPIKSMS
jgi:hypothetical protein